MCFHVDSYHIWDVNRWLRSVICVCVICALYTSGSDGLSACINCTAGTFSTTGSTLAQCASCPAGSIGATSGLSTCAQCSAGYFADLSGGMHMGVCAICWVFHDLMYGESFVDNTSLQIDFTASTCKSCLPGAYTSLNGAAWWYVLFLSIYDIFPLDMCGFSSLSATHASVDIFLAAVHRPLVWPVHRVCLIASPHYDWVCLIPSPRCSPGIASSRYVWLCLIASPRCSPGIASPHYGWVCLIPSPRCSPGMFNSKPVL